MDINYDAALNLIHHLSTSELRDLMKDEERLTNMVTDLPQVICCDFNV